MALKAPATYWQNRARASSTIAMLSFGGFVAAAVVVGLILNHYGSDLRAWIIGPEGRVDTAALVALAPIALLMLWLFRFFTRLYGVAVSEAVDAGQRRVMVTTFLAIMNDRNAGLSDAERILILQALFRQSGSKDDSEGLPANVVEAIVKAAQGKM
jgi:hypothetical protein